MDNSRREIVFTEWEGRRFYLTCHGYYMTARGRYLHRAIWEKANGHIPEGHHIHHRNRDPSDNHLGNLQCLTASDHHRLHGSDPRKRSTKTYGPALCLQCSKPFEKVVPKSIYCSRACLTKASNHQRHVKLSVQRAEFRAGRKCLCCGKPFERSRRDAVHCSMRCAVVTGKRARNARIGHVPTPAFYRIKKVAA